MSKDYSEIVVTREKKTAVITFDRQRFGNAFSLSSYAEITSAVETLSRDSTAGCVVLTGAGKNFSAGGDLNRFRELIESGTYLEYENILAAGRMAAAVRRCPKPVVAMVNGAAAGAGCSLALACDFRVVTPKSRFIMAFINLGLSGDTGGMYCLQRLVGTGRALEMMMTGVPVFGEEAVRIGLASRLAPEGELTETVMRLARELAERSPLALRRQKQLMNETFYADFDKYSEREAEFMTECSRSKEFSEAVYRLSSPAAAQNTQPS